MNIKNIKFKNLKSYGNGYKDFSLDKESSLILIQGDNGSGKSALENTLSFGLYGKVRGKKTKYLPMSDIPNRINKNLEVFIEATNDNLDTINIKRCLEPKENEILCNGNNITKEYIKGDSKTIERYVDVNHELYNSLISLNMNDFKDFISLKKEDKDVLINKLFNLSDLQKLFSYTNELYNNSSIEIANLKDSKKYFENKLIKYETIIEKIETNQNNILKDEIKTFKEELKEKGLLYNKIEKEYKDSTQKGLDLVKKIKECKENININIKNKNENLIYVNDLKNKLKLYKTGLCPLCGNEIHNDEEKSILELEDSLNSILNEYKENCILEKDYETDLNTLKDIRNKEYNNYKEKDKERNKLLLDAKELRNNIKMNTKQLVQTESLMILEEKKEIEEKLKETNDKLETFLEKNKNYTILKKIFKGNDIRKEMIESILIPMNKNLEYFSKELGLENQSIKLDENFNVEIINRFNINPETLSKGEDKKVNLAISLSYLEVMLKTKYMNIMFLDEVFDGLDRITIPKLLKLLKDISIKHKMYIFVVNHMTEDLSFFDTIINVEKNIFSDFEIQNIKK